QPKAAAMRAANPSRSASDSYVVRGQKKPRKPSPFRRGTTCACRCGTLWEILVLTPMNVPCASRPLSTARETRCTADQKGPISAAGSEWKSSTCAVGTTRTCPLNTGRASRNAATLASRSTNEAGTSPRRMAQKAQGGATSAPLHGPGARRLGRNASCWEHGSFTKRFHPMGRAVSRGTDRAASARQGDDGNAQANCPLPHRYRRLRWRRLQGPGPRRHAEQGSDLHGIATRAAAGEQPFREHDRPELHRRRSLAVPRPDGGGGLRFQRSHRRI